MHSAFSGKRGGLTLVFFVIALIMARPARACGGFFCSATPVDQTAERIIFTVNGNDTLTAYVQISYTGQRDSFAWVVPVPSVPQLGTFPRRAIQALDLATQPVFVAPACTYPPGFEPYPALVNGGGGSVAGGHSVTVYSQQAVGPYQTAVIGGTTTSSLVDWLRTNGYVLTDPMIPFIEMYVRDSMLFLAMKLLPDKDVSDIEPVTMTYVGREPMVPLRLTAVAARPQMGVMVWILSNQRFGPTNYADLTIADDEIQFDFGTSNYQTVVSRRVHGASGHGFVTEYAGATAPILDAIKSSSVPQGNQEAADARTALVSLLEQFPYMTRLLTRLSAEDMTLDPTFSVATSQTGVALVHDLSKAGGGDAGPCEAPTCSFTDCGQHGSCVEITNGPDAGPAFLGGKIDACICDDSYVARATTPSFSLGAGVHCEPVTNNLMPMASDSGAGPCAGFDCGRGGECVAINGNATCKCLAGYAANAALVYQCNGTVPVLRCVDIAGPVPQPPNAPAIECPPAPVTGTPQPVTMIGPSDASAGSATRPPMTAGGGGACACNALGTTNRGGMHGWLALAVLALATRRRQSRQLVASRPR